MRASRKWVVLGIAVGLLALWRPAGAAATPIDTASDHAALVAYHDYVEGLLSSLPSARTAMSDYVSKISARCPDVLAPIAGLPAGSLNRAATLAVIEELGGDVGAAAHPALRAPLRRMAATLAGLRWSSGQTGQTITSFVAAQRRLYGLGPSHLCTDLRAFVGSIGQTTPPGTLHWLARVARVESAQASRVAAFGAVLGRFLRPSDVGLLDDTSHAFDRLTAGFKAILGPEVNRLLAALGLPTD